MPSLVVAFAENRGIGYRGQLPWRLPSDLRRFRELTLGGTVLMGRRTFESLPDAFRPLPGRRNLIVSADLRFRPQDPDADRAASGEGTSVELYRSLDAALAAGGEDCFAIGGGSIYEQALPFARRVYATLVQGQPPSDTFFPPLASADWRQSELGERLHENGHTFRFAVYDRRRRRQPPSQP